MIVLLAHSEVCEGRLLKRCFGCLICAFNAAPKLKKREHWDHAFESRSKHEHMAALLCVVLSCVRGCIQKFPDWPPGAITTNCTALSCPYVQLYPCFVSQSSAFCRHKPMCCLSKSVYCCLFRYRLSPETFRYTPVRLHVGGS